MIIGVLELHFLIPGSRSLKEKRRVMSSLKQVLRKRHNCSVAETDHQELWGRAQLAVCIVAQHERDVREQLDKVVRFAETHADAELVDHDIELV